MVGLGLGSHAGGVLCERRSPRRALLTFALIEIGIAVWGALSGPLLYDVLSLRLSGVVRPAAARRARAVRVPHAAHVPDGDVAAVPRARAGGRHGGGGAHRRLPVRPEHAGRRHRRARHALGAGALPRHARGAPLRGRREPAGRPGRAALLRGRGDAARGGSAGGARSGAAARPVARALRDERPRGARARDPLVPSDRRRRQVERLHVRDRARHVPRRLRAGHAPGHAPAGALRTSAPRVPALPGRHPPVYGRRGAGAGLDSPAHAVTSRGSSTCGAGGARTTWAAPGSGGPCSACTCCCRWRSTGRRRF